MGKYNPTRREYYKSDGVSFSLKPDVTFHFRFFLLPSIYLVIASFSIFFFFFPLIFISLSLSLYVSLFVNSPLCGLCLSLNIWLCAYSIQIIMYVYFEIHMSNFFYLFMYFSFKTVSFGYFISIIRLLCVCFYLKVSSFITCVNIKFYFILLH